MTRLLVLRPEPGASETVERARSRGLDAVAIPLFEIAPVEWQLPEAARFDGLLLTSANAVRCGGDHIKSMRGLPVHAVGEATARAARDAGFDIASTGDAGVDRLLQSIDPELKLLHLAGEHRTAPTDAAQEIAQVVVYRARPVPHPDLTGTEDSVALIHSARAAGRFAQLIDGAPLKRETYAVAAISEAALDACGGGWSRAEAADKPSDEALLALAATLCNNLQQQ